MTKRRLDLPGAHVLVTGASRGIGTSIARAFAAEGANVSLLARTASALESLAADLGGTAYAIDLSDPLQVDSAIAKIEAGSGPIDVLINNAAVAPVGNLIEETAESLRRTFTVNVTSPIELCRQVLPGMLQRQRGAIANISSLAGITALPTLAVYGSSKAALAHFTSAMQRELRRTQVRFTIVQLGEVAGTELMESARRSPTIAAISRRLGRTRALPDVTPQDVASAMVEAVQQGRRHCIVPRRVTPLQLIREFPSRVNDGILIGIE